MDMIIGSDCVKALDMMVEYLSSNKGSAFIFANSKALTHRLLPALEAKMDTAQIHCDVLHIHGSLSSDEKFNLTRIFCKQVKVTGFNPRVLMATAAADLGMNRKDAEFVTEMKWPRNIASYVQRCGRAAQDGRTATMHLIAGLSSYLWIMRTIHSPGARPG